MEPRDDQNLPAQQSAKLPASARNFTTPELEAVIRRAVELQAGHSARTEDGISEADVVRIGQDLGLEPSAVRRAMAEVRSRPPDEHGVLVGFVGARTIRASRLIPKSAATTAGILDRHMRDVEFMIVQRRFTDRTRYVHDPSFAARVSRFAQGFARRHQPLNLMQVDVAVSVIDAESCLVELSIDLGVTRGGLVAGVMGSSSVLAAGWAAAVWATPIPDPLMLVGAPALAGAWYGMRAIYRAISKSAEEKLNSFLDRLEHDDLKA